MPLRKGPADGQRELRAGAEAGMRRQHAKKVDLQRRVAPTATLEQMQALGSTLDLGLLGTATRDHLLTARSTQLEHGFVAVNDQPQAAEAPAQRPGGVEKTQM